MITVEPATLRDASFVAGNMRALDWREIACQWPEGATPADVAASALNGASEAWIAKWKGQPVACVGFQRVTVSVMVAWGFGTRSMWRVAPALSLFLAERRADLVADGVTRVEARCLVENIPAQRWMIGMDAELAPCPAWGRDGEDFALLWWTR